MVCASLSRIMPVPMAKARAHTEVALSDGLTLLDGQRVGSEPNMFSATFGFTLASCSRQEAHTRLA